MASYFYDIDADYRDELRLLEADAREQEEEWQRQELDTQEDDETDLRPESSSDRGAQLSD